MEEVVMVMDVEWQAKVESKLDNHDKDLHNIAVSLEGINHQMGKTNEILQDFALKDEKFNSKIDRLDTKVCARIQRLEELNDRLVKRLDRLDDIVARITWTVVTFVVVGVLAAVVKFGGA